jgi:hypothetical protein
VIQTALRKEKKRMRTLIALIVTACFSLTAFAQQSTLQTKPDPELKKLAVYVGQWKYEGEYKPGPLGPAGKATGDATGEMILRGFFLEWRWKEKASTTETRGLEILNYDPMNRNYASTSYTDDGSSSSGAYVLGGNTFNYSGKFVVSGKQYLSRATEVFAADLASFAQKAEISVDGKTWLPYFEAKFTKAKPAPKK